jgi:hypothetical protein
MKPWLRLTLITITVGGGFAGLAATLQALFNSPGASTLNLLVMIVFMGLYAFVMVSGLIFVHDPRRTGPVVAALAIQIPWISSPLIVYKFAAGVQAFVMAGSPEKANSIGVHFYWDLLLGSSWRFAVLQDNSWGVGLNVAALAILAMSWQALRWGRQSTSPTNAEPVTPKPAIQTP